MTLPSLVDIRTMSSSWSLRLPAATAIRSPEGDGSIETTTVYWRLAALRREIACRSPAGRSLSRNGLKRSFRYLSNCSSNSSGFSRNASSYALSPPPMTALRSANRNCRRPSLPQRDSMNSNAA